MENINLLIFNMTWALDVAWLQYYLVSE